MNPEPDQKNCCKDESLIRGVLHLKFKECGIETQVERLHAEVIGLRQANRWMNDYMNRMATKLHALEHHQHSEKGDCMIRIEDTNRGGNEMSVGVCSSIDYLA